MRKFLAFSTIIRTIMATRSSHTAAVIWAHGLGDTGDGWAELEYAIGRTLPHIKWVFPTAPIQAVTINGGARMHSWFDIGGIPLKKKDFENPSGLSDSVDIMQGLIREQISNGISSSRIVVGGFSQGAVLSLATSFAASSPLAGVVAFSGWAPYSSQLQSKVTDITRDLPYLMCHGDADEVVNFTFGEMSAKALVDAGFTNVQFSRYAGMGHASCDREMQELQGFLSRILPPLQTTK